MTAGRRPMDHAGEGLSTADLAATSEHATAHRDADTQPGMEQPTPVEPTGMGTTATSLLAPNDVEAFRSRWNTIQTGFVDEPRQAVEQADRLVAEAIKRLAEGFAEERANLEAQWGRGDDISTEDLRVALQRYRSFFDRLLSL